jgi:endo-1,3(4)-beta-glucanase
MILSAQELGTSTTLTTDSLQPFSVNANLAPATEVPQIMTLPLVQGMGFVTALYRACTPLIQTSVFFRELLPAGVVNDGITSKYRVTLEDGNLRASVR